MLFGFSPSVYYSSTVYAHAHGKKLYGLFQLVRSKMFSLDVSDELLHVMWGSLYILTQWLFAFHISELYHLLSLSAHRATSSRRRSS